MLLTQDEIKITNRVEEFFLSFIKENDLFTSISYYIKDIKDVVYIFMKLHVINNSFQLKLKFNTSIKQDLNKLTNVELLINDVSHQLTNNNIWKLLFIMKYPNCVKINKKLLDAVTQLKGAAKWLDMSNQPMIAEGIREWIDNNYLNEEDLK